MCQKTDFALIANQYLTNILIGQTKARILSFVSLYVVMWRKLKKVWWRWVIVCKIFVFSLAKKFASGCNSIKPYVCEWGFLLPIWFLLLNFLSHNLHNTPWRDFDKKFRLVVSGKRSLMVLHLKRFIKTWSIFVIKIIQFFDILLNNRLVRFLMLFTNA